MKKLLLISIFLSVIGCGKSDLIKEMPENGGGDSKLNYHFPTDIKINLPNFLNENLLTKSQNDFVLTPIWDSAFVVEKNSGNIVLVPINIDKPVRLLKISKDRTIVYSKPIKTFLSFNAVQTKGDGDDPTVIMVADDEISSDGMYSGVFTYSKPNGEFIYSCLFENNILKYVLVPDNLQGSSDEFYQDPSTDIAFIISHDIWNRSLDDNARCYAAYKPGVEYKINDDIPIDYQGLNLSYWYCMVPSMLDNGATNSEQRTTNDITINLEAGPGGIVKGGGTYPPIFTSATIEAVPNSGYRFVEWTGDFAGAPQAHSFPLTRSMYGKAIFSKVTPCIDLINGKSNPLPNMKLAPPNSWNFNGATFGPTRKENGLTKIHNGIDLSGEIGEPIYAMFEGIVDSEKYVIEQPNRINKKYPAGYNGDVDGSGNRIYINSMISGKFVQIGYWHLQAGNPIAINPRTGQIFKPGDNVFPGEIIGYLGITGNPNFDIPHLHLTLKENGVDTDPLFYLNAYIIAFNIYLSTPCDHL